MYAEQAKSFVQEIARQAIINDESIMEKEVSYDGFGIMPLLSITLFTDWFILFYYNPLGKMSFSSGPEPSGVYVSRLNGASKMMLEAAIRNRDYWEHSYMYGVESAYESLFQQLSYRRYKATPSDFLVNLHIGVMDLYKSLSKGLESLEPEQHQPLFIASIGEHRHDLIHTIASIIYESLASIANRFLGVDDEGWIHAIRTFSDIYPSIGKAPAGMNPLQQQLAVQLIEKLRHNREGMYPAISRLLLAVIGPYRDPPEISARTAFVIIKDAVYKELQKLPILHAKEPERIADYLPSNVTYNAASNTLTHTYLRGEPRVTRLSELNIPKVELTDHCNWQI